MKIDTSKLQGPAYLGELHDRIKEELVSGLSDLNLPDSYAARKALSTALMGIAGTVSEDMELDERQFIELARQAFRDSRLACQLVDKIESIDLARN